MSKPTAASAQPRANGARASKARLLLIAVATNAVVFAAVLSTLTLAYESNDDVGMAHIASGLLTGKPSSELVFTNILVGAILKQLYQWSDRVNWYTLYLLAAHFLSMTGLLFAFLRVRLSLLSFALFLLLFVEYEVGLLLWLQYTSVAMTAAIVSCVLLTSSSQSDPRDSRIATAYGGGLLVLAGIMRSDASFFALIVIGPFLVYRLISLRRWRPVLTMAAFGAIVLAAFGLSEWHYRSDPRWRDYRIVNAAHPRSGQAEHRIQRKDAAVFRQPGLDRRRLAHDAVVVFRRPAGVHHRADAEDGRPFSAIRLEAAARLGLPR